MLNCRVRIEVGGIPEEKADAIVGALSPDNVNFPPGLALDICRAGGALVVCLESRDRTNSLISSADEILEHISVSLKVMA